MPEQPDELLHPLPMASWRRWKFALLRVLLQSVGRLSGGIRIGLRTGFDSGMSLDYVYANRPTGWALLGRLIDRLYLNSIGWQRIRDRKQNLLTLLRTAVERLRAKGRPVGLLDIAAGPGRYILEAVASYTKPVATIRLRDADSAALEEARRIAQALQLLNVTFEQADAFDADSLAAVLPRPTIAVASGLYEQFCDDALVQRSLRGLARAVEPGGYLIYTNQPWHPQLELIARVLTTRNGRPWVMRCRSQADLDSMVLASGFTKLDMLADRDGIFTVSLAQRAGGR